MPFKYHIDLERCPDKPCPDGKYKPRTREAYRYLHNPARVPNNFNPPAYMPNPPHDPTCGSYALSFAHTLEAARKRYQGLVKRMGSANAALRYGDHIGLLELTPDDGAQCDPDKTGHFDLHEHNAVTWTERVLNYWPV